MKYLSPIGVCFTTASNTEQSRGKIISGPQHIVLTWGTRAFARDLLSIDISRVGKVPLDPSHHRMVWVVFAVWRRADRPVGPLAILSCDCVLSVEDWKSPSESPLQSFLLQLSFPGLRVSLAGRLAQDLSGVIGVQDLCSNSFPSLPHASVQLSVVFQGPKTKGSKS